VDKEYKRLYILIEGNDDERFFKEVLKPVLEKRYDSIIPYQYASQRSEKTQNFLNSIIAMKASYIIITDINSSPCVTHRKTALKAKKIKHKLIEESNICVAIKEIESWYLAGLNTAALKKIGISYHYKSTDTLTKEQFDRLMPDKFRWRISFMMEILKHFQLDVAKQNNRSFKYFLEKYNLG
jgi:hypothetical protein